MEVSGRKRKRVYDVPDVAHVCAVERRGRGASACVTTRIVKRARCEGTATPTATPAAATAAPHAFSLPSEVSQPLLPCTPEEAPTQAVAPARNHLALTLLQSIRQAFNPTTCEFTKPAPEVASLASITALCTDMAALLQDTCPLVDVESDCWVIGDVHGNFGDLMYFVRQLIPFDVSLCPYRIVCLGDYVDRGPHSLQCVLLLFCLKLLSPSTVNLLRGNHEDPSVCGDVEGYGDGSFRRQCHVAYGERVGEDVFARVCDVFSRLPLAAVIDRKIFCAHGGIPRFFPKRSAGCTAKDYRLDLLRNRNFPKYPSLFTQEAYEFVGADESLRQERERDWLATYDLLWSDPICDNRLGDLDDDGFASSERGGQAVAFSGKAVETFLSAFDLDLMIRAHQEKRLGLRVSQSSKVITVFSSSNYQNHGNGAGVVLVRKTGKVDLIMKTTQST